MTCDRCHEEADVEVSAAGQLGVPIRNNETARYLCNKHLSWLLDMHGTCYDAVIFVPCTEFVIENRGWLLSMVRTNGILSWWSLWD